MSYLGHQQVQSVSDLARDTSIPSAYSHPTVTVHHEELGPTGDEWLRDVSQSYPNLSRRTAASMYRTAWTDNTLSAGSAYPVSYASSLGQAVSSQRCNHAIFNYI